MISRKYIGSLAGLFLAGLFLSLTPGCSPVESSSKNLILITASGLRPDHLSLNGYSVTDTPNFDALALTGTTFEICRTPVPVGLPSAVSLLTGRYPSSHGVLSSSFHRLSRQKSTLPQALQQEGYRTAAFIGSGEYQSRFGISTGFDLFEESFLDNPTPLYPPFLERSASDTVDKFSDWLEKGGAGPFFAWIQWNEATLPHAAPEPFFTNYRFNSYDGEIAYMDLQIARIRKLLEERGLAENTVIALSAEFAEALGENNEKGHGWQAFESTLKVPFIIHHPDWESSHRAAVASRTIDVMPTLMGLLGLNVPEGLDGVDLSPYCRKDAPAPPELPLQIENFSLTFNFNWVPSIGLIKGSWKYLNYPEEGLYQLEDKKGERNNLMIREPEKFEQMKSEWQQSMENQPLSTPMLPLMQQALDTFGEPDFSDQKNRVGLTPPQPPASMQDFLLRLEMLIRQQRLDEVRDLLTRRLDDESFNPALLRSLGHIHLMRNLYPQAITAYRKAVTILPIDDMAWSGLGSAYMASGDLTSAAKCFSVSVLMSPGTPQYVYNLGSAFLESKDYEESIEAFQHALDLGSRSSSVYYNLGVAQEALGQKDAAIKSFHKARLYWSGSDFQRSYIDATLFRLERDYTPPSPPETGPGSSEPVPDQDSEPAAEQP